MTFKYKYVILGGTFDRLHIGHQKLISTACEQSEKITIGLTTEKFYKNKFLSELIQDYQTREKELQKFLQTQNYENRTEIIPLKDIYGTGLQIKDIDSIFVTEKTKPGALTINRDRKKTGFPSMKIITIPFVKDENNKIITSEKIRYGEIDRNGHIYMNIFKNKTLLTLPADLRPRLRQPIGEIAQKKEEIKKLTRDKKIIITVGDIVTLTMDEIGKKPDISIIDHHTRRQEIDNKRLAIYLATQKPIYNNKPGTINKKVINAFRSAVKSFIEKKEKQQIAVNGEEDLLTLPVILLAPLGSTVLYGQFNVGSVIVDVTEEKKKYIENLLQKFD